MNLARAWTIRLLLIVNTGCQALSGLDGERDQATCESGRRRCSRGTPEICSEGRWESQHQCDGVCVAGECQQLVIAAGHNHTCLRTADGGAQCLGRDDMGQLGLPSTTSCKTCVDCPDIACVEGATNVPEVAGVRSLSSMDHHTCAVSSAPNQIRCWGSNDFGQLGESPGTPRVTPAPVSFPLQAGEFVEVRAGGGTTGPFSSAHTCALTRTGELYCWGANCAGQLGLGVGTGEGCPVVAPSCPKGDVATNLATPTRVNLSFAAIAVATGAVHTCALSATGNVYCWGLNYFEQAGVPEPVEHPCVISPTRVVGVEGATQLVAGSLHTCALVRDGAVVCWGRTDKGVLGEVVEGLASRGPKRVPGLQYVVELATGTGTHVCARERDGSLVCWGGNDDGDLGIIDTIGSDWKVQPGSLPPTTVPTIPVVTGVGVGGNHTCVWDEAGAPWCWGQAAYGAVGAVSFAPITPGKLEFAP